MKSPAPTASIGLRHVVLLRAAPNVVMEERNTIEAALAELVSDPKFGSQWSLQRDLGLRPDSDRVATWMASIDFESECAFHKYLTSPQHVGFLRKFGGRLETVLAIQTAL